VPAEFHGTPSTTWPSWRSSDTSTLEPATDAARTTRVSRNENAWGLCWSWAPSGGVTRTVSFVVSPGCGLCPGKERQAERCAAVAHAEVQAQEVEPGEGGGGGQCGGEMDGVEAPDRLDREALSGPRNDLFVDPEAVPGGAGVEEAGSPIGRRGLGELAERLGTVEDPLALDEGQLGSEDPLRRTERVADLLARGLGEEPGEDGARLCVEAQRSPRASSRSRAARPGERTGSRRG